MKKGSTYKGHETFHNAFRMSLKLVVQTFFWIAVLHLLLTLYLTFRWYGEYLSVAFQNLLQTPSMENINYLLNLFLLGMKSVAKTAALIWLTYPLFILFYRWRAKSEAETAHLRGAKLISPRRLNKAIRSDHEKVDLQIGKVGFPKSAEVKHALILGRPGAGKTVLLSSLLERLMEREQRGIVYDFKGDYVARFYRPDRDLLFNPVDERCLAWNLFDEIRMLTDIDVVAHALIPTLQTNDPFWNNGARDVFSGLLHALYQRNLKTNADIWKAVSAPGKEISASLAKIPGAEAGFRCVEEGKSKQAMSILSVMMQYVKCFEHLSRLRGGFRIADWLDQGKGWLFVTNYPGIADTLRPMISLFIDLIGRRLLSLKDDPHRRIYFFIDEFGTLQPLSIMVQLLTLSRSKGGSVWLGIQDIGQIDKIFGASLRQAIINACGTTAIFSVSDPQSAKFLSTKIGETEFLETEETYSMGVADTRDGLSLMRRRKVEPLVLPSEVMHLRDLELFLKIPNYDLTKTKLTWQDYPVMAESLRFRRDLEMSSIKSQPVDVPETASLEKGDPGQKRSELDYDLEIDTN
ncbi:MAG: type IV secretion system DNA-binding domain-containing protein [Nitrospiria bacterium]